MKQPFHSCQWLIAVCQLVCLLHPGTCIPKYARTSHCCFPRKPPSLIAYQSKPESADFEAKWVVFAALTYTENTSNYGACPPAYLCHATDNPVMFNKKKSAAPPKTGFCLQTNAWCNSLLCLHRDSQLVETERRKPCKLLILMLCLKF